MDIDRLKNIFSNKSFIAFIYLLLLLIFFRKVFIEPDYIVFGTDAIGHFNITNYLRELIHKNWQYPLWIPVHFGGMPHFDATLATNVNFFALIYYVFPLTLAFNLYMVLHFWFAGYFTFLFAEYLGLKRKSAFLSGLVFMFSGVLVSHLFVGHIPKVGT